MRLLVSIDWLIYQKVRCEIVHCWGHLRVSLFTSSRWFGHQLSLNRGCHRLPLSLIHLPLLLAPPSLAASTLLAICVMHLVLLPSILLVVILLLLLICHGHLQGDLIGPLLLSLLVSLWSLWRLLSLIEGLSVIRILRVIDGLRMPHVWVYLPSLLSPMRGIALWVKLIGCCWIRPEVLRLPLKSLELLA
jgi:hypothetical protein